MDSKAPRPVGKSHQNGDFSGRGEEFFRRYFLKYRFFDQEKNVVKKYKQARSSWILLLIFLAIPASGCNDNLKIRGTITLEDGTPVPNGTVFFQGETNQSYGNIKPDGTY